MNGRSHWPGFAAIVTGGQRHWPGHGRAAWPRRAMVAIAARNPLRTARRWRICKSWGVGQSRWNAMSPIRVRLRQWWRACSGQLGRMDILVNNAGTNIRKRPEVLAEDEWHTVLDTNLSSAFVQQSPLSGDAAACGWRSSTMVRCCRFSDRLGGRVAAACWRYVQRHQIAWPPPGPQTTSRSIVSCRAGIDTALTQTARQQIEGLNEKVQAGAHAR
ncbi:MAG: SDR family NAD(P)-dependent oxidoreductase [Gammaproteobacteria bacterium]